MSLTSLFMRFTGVGTRISSPLNSLLHSTRRGFAQAVETIKNASEAGISQNSAVRNTFKSPDSRKTYLMDRYTHIVRNSPVMLIVQHNNLLKQDSLQLRNQLSKLDARMTILRVNIFKVTLRNIKDDDPASKQAQKAYKRMSHPISHLLAGPTCTITLKKLDPPVLKKVIEVIDKSGGRLALMGAQIEDRIMDREQINWVQGLGTEDQIRGELLGCLEVLRGAGLINTLQSAGTHLYLTLEGRKKQLDEGNSSDST
ncbi:hypothetical protein V1511DRAFT_498580 [Dipodascopsis uninucleata]